MFQKLKKQTEGYKTLGQFLSHVQQRSVEQESVHELDYLSSFLINDINQSKMTAPITPVITAPTQLAPREIPSFPDSHPPNKKPRIPTITLAKRPNPLPLKRNPANQPISAPRTIQIMICNNIILK